MARLKPMQFSWEKHLELSRNVSAASDKEPGLALAVMGVGLTMLLNDLWLQEQQKYLNEEVSNNTGKRVS